MATTLNISLPEPLKAYVDAQAESGDYATTSDYIADLIQMDRNREQELLERHLSKALEGDHDAIGLTGEEVERGGIVTLLRQKMLERQGYAA